MSAAASTRTQILQHAQAAMQLHGYQGLRTDRVAEELGITKGAFYHWFAGKQEVGYAVVEELLTPSYLASFEGLTTSATALGGVAEALCARLDALAGYICEGNAHLGCPVNNLIQEMAPLDAGFATRLRAIISGQRALIAEALTEAKAGGTLRPDADPDQAALYILTCLEGAYSLSKLYASRQVFVEAIAPLKAWIRALRSELGGQRSEKALPPNATTTH